MLTLPPRLRVRGCRGCGATGGPIARTPRVCARGGVGGGHAGLVARTPRVCARGVGGEGHGCVLLHSPPAFAPEGASGVERHGRALLRAPPHIFVRGGDGGGHGRALLCGTHPLHFRVRGRRGWPRAGLVARTPALRARGSRGWPQVGLVLLHAPLAFAREGVGSAAWCARGTFGSHHTVGATSMVAAKQRGETDWAQNDLRRDVHARDVGDQQCLQK